MRLDAAGLCALVLLAVARPAGADSDGVYGRFDGDLDLSPIVGTQLAEGGAGALVGARALFLGTVGAYALLNETWADRSPAPRTLAIGTSFRPFFIPRWGLDREQGPAWLDLTLDATAFELGALWVGSSTKRFSEAAGFEAALGTEVPLLGRAAGPWIGVRGSLRWRGAELLNDSVPRLGPALGITLSWHFLAQTHLVDFGDTIER